MSVILLCVVVAVLLCDKSRSNAVAVYVGLLLLLLCSCATTRYVPVNQIRHTTTIERDTIFEIVTPPDSVANTTTDTTSVISTRYATSTARVIDGVLTHTLAQHARKDSVQGKTVYVFVTDSVPYPVEVEVVREVVPTWSWWSLVVSAVMLCVGVVRVVSRFNLK